MRTLETLSGGEWLATGEWIDVHDPSDLRTPVARVPALSAADVTRAYDHAERGFAVWKRTSPFERARIMTDAARLLRERVAEIAEDLATEMGKTRAEATGETIKAADFLEYYAGIARQGYGTLVHDVRPDTRTSFQREPIGIVLAITPWNDPLITPARKLAPTLAAGNAALLKPATDTPQAALHFARALHDAGLLGRGPQRDHRPRRADLRGADRRPAARRAHLHRQQRGRRGPARPARQPQRPLPGRARWQERHRRPRRRRPRRRSQGGRRRRLRAGRAALHRHQPGDRRAVRVRGVHQPSCSPRQPPCASDPASPTAPRWGRW